MTKSAEKVSKFLLRWYDAERRDLPWRASPGETPDPYHVWLSEIMLQQTTVVTVMPYYGNFLARWPKLHDLAQASLDDVLHAWQGLGYYSRARNLHKCAVEIVRHHNGRFPDTEPALQKLPGIGPYTAAAIAAIAFDRKASPVDGNIERVIARLHGVETPLPGAKKELKVLAESHTPAKRAGDFAQALMDLGATVCKPKAANCAACPLPAHCKATGETDPTRYPLKAPKKQRPTRYGIVFWTVRTDGAVLLRRRPESGLLGGMMEFPSTPWRESPWPEFGSSSDNIADEAPVPADWQHLDAKVVHVFTHFRLELDIVAARTDAGGEANAVWCRPEDFSTLALPTVMKKVAVAASTTD